MQSKLKVSFIIPTLNEEAMLRNCIEPIIKQNYPKELIEIVIADGGSKDKTVEIAKEYGCVVVVNNLKTAESGKAVGIANSSGDIICLIDADNLITDLDWISKMVKPLEENLELVGVETKYFEVRPEDGFIDRYCGLIGMNDPLCLWLGTYDRFNYLTGKWTGLDIETSEKDGVIIAKLESGNIPTIGANGCMFRKSIFENNEEFQKEYLFDVDILETLTRKIGPVKFGLVDVGIVHLYCGSNFKTFRRKQYRRVKDYLYRRNFASIVVGGGLEERKYTYAQKSSTSFMKNILLFSFSCLLFIPLLYQTIKGYMNKRDTAWFAHPILCWITFVTYFYGLIESLFNSEELSRENWDHNTK